MADITQPPQSTKWKTSDRLVDPDNDVVRALNQASSFIKGTVLPPVDLAATLLGLAETAAPFYANAPKAVLRLAIKEFREFLYSLRLSGHYILVDVPYGFSHGGALPQPGAFDRLMARAESLTPKDMWTGVDSLATGGSLGGAQGLLKVLSDSIVDPGDGNKPDLTGDSTFCGISIVVSAPDIARLMNAIRAVKRVIAELFGGEDEPEPTGLKLEIKVKQVSGRPLLRVKDWTDYPLGKLGVGGWEIVNKPYAYRIWASSTPGDASRIPYYADSTIVPEEYTTLPMGGSDVTGRGGWKLVGTHVVDPKTVKTIQQFPLLDARLRELAPITDGKALEQWNLRVEALHYMHVDDYIMRDSSFSNVLLYTPIATGRPESVSEAPNWSALSPADIPRAAGTLSRVAAKRDALIEVVTNFDDNVLSPWEDELKDKSDQLVKTIKKAKKKAQKIRDLVVVVDSLLEAIAAIAKLEATLQGRAFNYFELLDKNKKKGVEGLISEYTESFAELKQQGGKDLTAGFFFVMAGPASLGPQFLPIWKLLCSLLNISSTTKDAWSDLGRSFGGPTTSKAAATGGQLDAGPATASSALVGEQDDGTLDLNCPPARDLSQLQFGPDFTPLA